MKWFFAVLATAALTFVMHSQLAAEAPKPAEKMFRHVVLIKFKDGSKPEDVKELVSAFAALPKKIDAIVDFEWGTDVGVENLGQGYTHCILLTFRDAKGRDAYLPHRAHEEFKKLALPHIDKVLVVDYMATH